MAGAVYNNFVQQPNQGNSFAEAFQKGYGLMDSVYQAQRKIQLTSKLAELYTSDPNMDTMTRIRKTVPLLAMYGDTKQAMDMEKNIAAAEAAAATKAQTYELAQQRITNTAANEPLVKVQQDDGTVVYVPRSQASGKSAPITKPKVSNIKHWKTALHDGVAEYYDTDTSSWTGVMVGENPLNPTFRNALNENPAPAEPSKAELAIPDFADVKAANAFATKHKLKPGTKVKIGGKPHTWK